MTLVSKTLSLKPTQSRRHTIREDVLKYARVEKLSEQSVSFTPDIAENFKLDTDIYCGELDFNTIMEFSTFEREYKSLPKFPASNRDIALVIDKSISVGKIEKILNDTKHGILESYKLFDVYEGQQVGENKKSVAYSLTFRAPDRTLTDNEINDVLNNILEKLKNCLGAELR